MTNLEITLIIFVISSIYSVGFYVDKQYNLSLIDWFNGKCSTPFEKRGINKKVNVGQVNKTEELIALQARIQVLETIVTEPAFELNQKINALK
jgi:hypothetical protein